MTLSWVFTLLHSSASSSLQPLVHPFDITNTGVLFPIVANRTRVLRVPPLVFFSVKHFGTGVIIATAFIHVYFFISSFTDKKLLPSAFENLTSHCLPPFFTDEYPSFAGLIAMTAMLIIFFVEFGSSRYLAKVDKKIMQMQLCDPTNQNSLVQPVKSLLIRRNVVVNGRLVNIDPTMAGEAADRVTETLIRETSPDEESPLLNNEEGRKPHHDSHCGHHHYDPPPVDGHGSLNDVTRKSQLLGVAILEGGLCFHSIFVGLTLAVATGGGFISLLIAIMFHRMSSIVK
jgi:hypothetical protein